MGQPKTKDMPIISLTGRERRGMCFALNGTLFEIGHPVIKWDEPKGFSFYDTSPSTFTEEDRRTGELRKKTIKGRRYSKRKGGLKDIFQFFVHHSGGDGANPSGMYTTLHNRRKLSCHYAVEDDGRIWQFGDGIDQAWHAGSHNPQSIGVECALYPSAFDRPDFYSERRRKKTGNLPHKIVQDRIHGRKMEVFAFTDPQVDALAKLAAGNWFALLVLNYFADTTDELPKAVDVFRDPPRFPRSGNGKIPKTVFPGHADHVGLIGHLQCTKRKWDPAGFPWLDFESRAGDYFEQFKAQTDVFE